ncbi:nucleoside permease [Bacillus sp. TH13]|uniref:nucleoside permease n=1 Tax=Bacillus sp. TH13 TaxID=2796379 RepID=UPI001913D6EB|nr:nucleoside permease [Bacillus sp. TH13]MBK5492221.1 nucleoside permease [Bacillus sp. TH13]
MALNRWLTDEERARAAANGITRNLLYYRVFQAEWDVEIAITAPPGTVKRRPSGKYAKWIELAESNGISKGAFYSRLKVGMGCKEAATVPLKKSKGLMEVWLEIAKPNGIGYQTFMSRINTRNWDIEKAATTPTIRTGKNCSVIAKEKVL